MSKVGEESKVSSSFGTSSLCAVITMTEAGRRQLDQLDTLIAALQDELLSPLAQSERDQLTRLLTRLLDHHTQAG